MESKHRHPACHVFAVDASGTEYILDVSYKEMKIGDEFLLSIAEREYETRLERLGDAIDRIEDFFHGLFSSGRHNRHCQVSFIGTGGCSTVSVDGRGGLDRGVHLGSN